MSSIKGSPWTAAKVGFYAPMKLRDLNPYIHRPEIPQYEMRLDYTNSGFRGALRGCATQQLHLEQVRQFQGEGMTNTRSPRGSKPELGLPAQCSVPGMHPASTEHVSPSALTCTKVSERE